MQVMVGISGRHRGLSSNPLEHFCRTRTSKSASGDDRKYGGRMSRVAKTRLSMLLPPLNSSLAAHPQSGLESKMLKSSLFPELPEQPSPTRDTPPTWTEVILKPSGSGRGASKKVARGVQFLSCRFLPSSDISSTIPPFSPLPFIAFSTASLGPTPDFISTTGVLTAPALKKISPAGRMHARITSCLCSASSSVSSYLSSSERLLTLESILFASLGDLTNCTHVARGLPL
mmetsp:Transcript_19621/g.47544  ORF Transcript_19621/g.47544 Transcript_19621/m.47544 type:complete len:230 (-) Transcript_19621:115-804(-)